VSATTSLRPSTRAVLLLGIAAGVSGVAVTLVTDPRQFALASDVYVHAARTLIDGGDIYANRPPDRPGLPYLYPPIVTVLFVPHALLGSDLAAFALQTVLNLAAGAATAVVVARALARRGVAVTRADTALFAAFVTLSTYGAIQLVNGQVNLWLGLAFAVGFDRLDRDPRLAGAAFALAALVKVFPAAVGVLLLRLRAWRAVAAAVVTGVGGLAAGLVLGPGPTETYLTRVLVERYRGESFQGLPSPTANVGGIQRQLATLGVDPPWLTPLALLLVGAGLALVYRRVETPFDRQVAGLATVVAILLFFPLQPLYFPLLVFPLLVVLVRLPSGRPRLLLLVGTLFSFVRLGHEQVASAVAAAGLPGAVEAPLLTASLWLFTFVRPATVGLALVLIACALVAGDGRVVEE